MIDLTWHLTEDERNAVKAVYKSLNKSRVKLHSVFYKKARTPSAIDTAVMRELGLRCVSEVGGMRLWVKEIDYIVPPPGSNRHEEASRNVRLSRRVPATRVPA